MNMQIRRRPQAGFTLVELMVSMAIGLLIVLALITLLINVNRNNSEMTKTNRQIENGRFAIQLLQNDLIHAGFWGPLRPATPSAMPAPCPISWNDANILGIPVFGFNSSTITANCPAFTGVQVNSDVLVVRHADTCEVGSTVCDGGTDTGPHIQVSNCSTTPSEEAYVIDSASFPLRDKDCTAIAARRKLISNIYYVSDNRLMRVELKNGTYQTQPMVEGIEAFRVEYGIDNNGDGSADEFKTTSLMAGTAVVPCADVGTACNFAANTVAVKIHVLARNLETSPGYTTNKSYQLGATTAIPDPGDGVKRHVYSTTVRLVNPSSRRERP
ncbi:PilW family protein [Rhodoferax sp.]|uniref:PilW family protein n=1 Tax=Rhodoferax sp. TaxID=50421 RepID=UPI0019DB9C2E|nr:PilW family protein [Rhodoferax sp.]MBE0472944.1 PilW family protein [Rhodoferax sp.]